MTNKNLPPGWKNRNSIAKPDWGNEKKEPFKQKIKSVENAIDSENPDISNSVTIIPDNEKIEETIAETEVSENVSVPEQAIKLPTKNESVLSISDVEQTEKKTSESKASENIYVSEPIAEEYTEKGAAKKSNAVIIVLIMLLIALAIAIGVFAALYFTKDKAKDNIDTISGYDASVTELAGAIDETTAATEITTTTTTTTVTTTITTSSTTEKVTTNKKLNESDYIGFWNMRTNNEHELTIHFIDSEKVVFSVWYYRLTSIEYVTANLEENKAYFNKDEVSGYLIFNDKSITLGITMSSIAYLPSNTEEIYDMHVNESIQHGNSSANAEIVNLNEPLYGEINCHQKNVSGYDSSYICNGNTISTVRDTLSDKWHITTSKLCYNYGTWWYECYDSDDGDYYGWVDSSFIDFYENNSVPYEDELVEPYIERETTIVDDIEFEYITYYADSDIVVNVKSISITHTMDMAYYDEYEVKVDAEINDKLEREKYLVCYMYDSDGYKIDEAALGKVDSSINESYKLYVSNKNTAKIFISVFA